jgi:hypothetical protein
MFDGMKPDRHAASGQGRNCIAFENGRGGKSRREVAYLPPQIRIRLAGKHHFSSPASGQMEEGRCAALTVGDEERFELLEPVRTETMQRPSGQKKRGRHAEFTQHRQRVLSVTRQIVVERHRDGGASPSRHGLFLRPVLAQNFIQRDEIVDLAERLQLRSEQIDRYGRNNLAADWGSKTQTVVNEYETVSAESGERAHCPVYRRRPQ